MKLFQRCSQGLYHVGSKCSYDTMEYVGYPGGLNIIQSWVLSFVELTFFMLFGVAWTSTYLWEFMF
jgi:hypothetical protein